MVYRGPQIWNLIPENINVSLFNKFKERIKKIKLLTCDYVEFVKHIQLVDFI